MKDGEIPLGFLSRARLLRKARENVGVSLKDGEANRHITRCLSAEYDYERKCLLRQRKITDEMLNAELENAYAENQLSKNRDGNSPNHALAAASSNSREGRG